MFAAQTKRRKQPVQDSETNPESARKVVSETSLSLPLFLGSQFNDIKQQSNNSENVQSNSLSQKTTVENKQSNIQNSVPVDKKQTGAALSIALKSVLSPEGRQSKPEVAPIDDANQRKNPNNAGDLNNIKSPQFPVLASPPVKGPQGAVPVPLPNEIKDKAGSSAKQTSVSESQSGANKSNLISPVSIQNSKSTNAPSPKGTGLFEPLQGKAGVKSAPSLITNPDAEKKSPDEAKKNVLKKSKDAAESGEKSQNKSDAKQSEPSSKPAEPSSGSNLKPGSLPGQSSAGDQSSSGGSAPSLDSSGSAPSSGPAIEMDGSGGGESEGQETESAETEQKMEAASPENAQADAVAEAEEDPETAAEVSSIESEDNTSTDTGIQAEAGLTENQQSAEENGESLQKSSSASQVQQSQIETLTPHSTEPPSAEETAQSEGSATGAGEGLDGSEQRAAMESISSGGGSGEPAIGGGGGGGAAIEGKPEPDVPDVSGQEPEAAISSVENLPPGKVVGAIGGVSAAVNGSVAKQKEENSSNPPQAFCSSGSPVTKQSPGPKNEAVTRNVRKIQKANEGSPQPVPQPQSLPVLPPSPVSRVSEPGMTTSGAAPLGPGDAEAIKSSVSSLPTSDPGLNIDAGRAPSVNLAGDADPGQVRDQGARLNEGINEAASNGRLDAGQPMGEDEIYPSVQPEMLSAEPASEGPVAEKGDKPSAQKGGGSDSDEAASIVAQQQNGPQLKAAANQAKSQMATERAGYAEKAATERANNQKEIASLETENAGQQNLERINARAEVAKARGDWTSEQQEKVDSANKEAQGEQQKADQTVAQEEQQGNEQAQQQIDQGNQEAATHRESAEREAEQKRVGAEQESEGIFGWIASKAKAFFNKIKSAINAVFDAARKLVKAAIEKAKKLAAAVIEKARQAIVAAIRAAGKALIAIGDRLLAAFPALRDKWRKFINSKVQAAEAAVNRLAAALKKGIQKLLDMLGKALDFALKMMQKGMLAIVNAYQAAVAGIIKAAKAVVEAVGAFISLIKDVAKNPIGWIKNLGAAVIDGIRNHLWKAFKQAVKNWFNSKLEEVLGIGGMIWGMLKKGGIAFKEVGLMAWEGLKSAIPVALITILVEKLVAMIVPAAGAVMAIIEGLQAAWGTVSRIIAAFGKFFAFLKAVKNGNAGPPFADAVAAAAVVVIDFVANWLLKKIRKPAGKIGSKIKAIANKIMARLKRVASRVGKAVKKAGQKVLGKVRAAKDKVKGWLDKRRAKKGKKDPNKKKQDKEAAKQKRLDKAVAAIRPKLEKLLAKGVSTRMLKLRLAFWRLRYRLSSLEFVGNKIVATVNPSADLEAVKEIEPAKLGAHLQKILASVEEEFFTFQEMNRSKADRNRISEAEKAISGGSKMHLGLSRPEQVELFRKIQSEKVKIPPPQRIPNPKKGGREFRSPIIRSGEKGFSTFANRDESGRPLLSRFYIISAGKYPYDDNVLNAPSRSGLVKVLEPARGRGSGLFVASEISQSLIDRGNMSPGEAFSGKNAPLATDGSARAMEVDQGLRPPSEDPLLRAEEDAARQHRLKALRNIFIKLSESLEHPPKGIIIINSAEEKALQELGKAFLDWARENFVRKEINTDEALAAEAVLKQKLFTFMFTRNLL
jgi:hypothetical protein